MSRTYNKLRGGYAMTPQIEHPILPTPVMNTVNSDLRSHNYTEHSNHDIHTEERLKPRGKNFDPISKLRKVAVKSKKITYKVGSSKSTPKKNLLTSLLSVISKN